jgi:hypothetical protein
MKRLDWSTLDAAGRREALARPRSRTEARSLIAFDTTATTVGFPFVEQAARLTRCSDSQRQPGTRVRARSHCDAHAMLTA